ncbi:MurR/RpiR family transcriptional regulator [Enterococcus sp. 669A]|uniref:MurR/RpiR family transcriptional regulator n=1 Tax=Candidatus Enterococcus moelleringii TaxID=2815325 RepID=A0ABS3LJ22_9ENTE|nr:MurR/RpiR family transcriptional regulator [Enterococcus sp. 669A]MBO1308359.1 MurR/RpiR family transcriptional regulator [Enterococcus sp. 669A]
MFSDKINQAYQSLNETDLSIVSVVTQNFNEIPKLGIERLSKMCNYSRTSILRTAKKLGFSGYAEMRNYIRWEIENNKSNSPTTIPTLETDVKQTLVELENTKHFDTIVDRIIANKRIFIYGTGEGQKNCANEIQRLFMQVGVYLFVIKASAEFQIIAKDLTKDDMVIVISLSGEIDRYKESIQLLKAKKIPLVSITTLSNNPLAANADYRLYAVSSSVLLNNAEAHVSFLTFYLLGECLFRRYIEKINLTLNG